MAQRVSTPSLWPDASDRIPFILHRHIPPSPLFLNIPLIFIMLSRCLILSAVFCLTLSRHRKDGKYSETSESWHHRTDNRDISVSDLPKRIHHQQVLHLLTRTWQPCDFDTRFDPKIFNGQFNTLTLQNYVSASLLAFSVSEKVSLCSWVLQWHSEWRLSTGTVIIFMSLQDCNSVSTRWTFPQVWGKRQRSRLLHIS